MNYLYVLDSTSFLIDLVCVPLYLFYVLMHELDDALVVLGVLVLQTTTLDDLHRFKRYLNGFYPLALNASR